jgi:dihydroorotate dehydrogenase (NAD+) catalytic subunit
VLVKLSPNVTDLVAIAARVAEAHVDGLTLINTLRGMAIDYRTGRPLLGNVIGGLSGPAIRPIAIRAVYEVSQALDIPIVGSGGIIDWRDAVEFMRAGASAVQVGSANFRNPKAAVEVLHGIGEYLNQNGHISSRELVKTVRVDG